MIANHPTQPTPPRAKLEQAIAMAKAGQKAEARDLLRGIVALQPVNQAAWMWLSAVALDKAEAEAALAKAREIDPMHPSLPRAERWFAHRFSQAPLTKKTKAAPKPAKAGTSKKSFNIVNLMVFGVVVVAVVIGLTVLFFGLFIEVKAAAQPGHQNADGVVNSPLAEESARLETALQQHEWAIALEILERQQRARPDSISVQRQLADVYFQQGVTLRDKTQVEQALASFEKSAQLAPDNSAAQQELALASTYVAGTQHYQDGQWSAAIEEFEGVWSQTPDYPTVRDLLYSAHYNQALAHQAAGELAEAKTMLEAAVALRPDLSIPRRLLTQVEFAMAAGTPIKHLTTVPLEDRLIVVGLAEQRMVVYEGDEQVFDFIVSTGEPGRETAIGEFEIQNKIDVAYASTWNLDMPYWMGIYWAGPLQNGIHSLPIVKHTGQKLWDGYLGQRVSYGCVILGDDDAATLYDWAEVGTKVKIVPSLAAWLPDQSWNLDEN